MAGGSIPFPDEWSADPVLMVDILPGGVSLGAERTFAVRILPGSSNFNDVPFVHVGIYATV